MRQKSWQDRTLEFSLLRPKFGSRQRRLAGATSNLSPRTLSGLLTLLALASIQSSATMTIYTSPFPSVEVNTESVHSFLLSPTKIATYKDRAALIDATTGQQVCVLSSCFSSFACELTRARAP